MPSVTVSLLDAVIYSDRVAIQECINLGVKVKPIDKFGRTEIHRAAKLHYIDEFYFFPECIFDAVGDVNYSDENGVTLLHIACGWGNTRTVQKFIDQGIDVNLECRRYYDLPACTPLHVAIENQRVEVIQLLLEKGADANKQNLDGLTPLQNAVNLFNYEAVKLLVEHGANIQRVDFKDEVVSRYIRSQIRTRRRLMVTKRHHMVIYNILAIFELLTTKDYEISYEDCMTISNILKKFKNEHVHDERCAALYLWENEISPKTMITDTVSISDLCEASPENVFKILNEPNYKSIVNSYDFQNKFCSTSEVLDINMIIALDEWFHRQIAQEYLQDFVVISSPRI
uniref:Uncharacterized protein n=1 Tax=Trichogramma kaykai TaxID=54128 RepID=A0ABD2X5N2_9HYME